MAVYTKLICSNCKNDISNGYVRSGFQSGIGLPFISCFKCGILNVTGKKPYKELNIIRKTLFWFYPIVKAFLYGGGIGMFVFGVFALIFNEELFESIYQKIFILGCIAYAIYFYLKENFLSIKAIDKANAEKNYTLYAFNG